MIATPRAFLVGARQDELDAQHQAGRLFLLGQPGVPKDLPRAARWIEQAALNGEAEARRVLRSNPALMAEVSKMPVQVRTVAPIWWRSWTTTRN